jgi:hypothetical protein
MTDPLTYFEQFPEDQRHRLITQQILSYWESHRENLAISRDKNHPFFRDAIRDLVEGTRLSQAFLDSPYAEKQSIGILGPATRLATMDFKQAAIKSRWNQKTNVVSA